MFSFIKFLQGKIAQLKSNKGLWFTTITVVSIVGIILCMALLMTMTSRVSQKVYVNMAGTYELKLETIINEKKASYKKVIFALSNDNALVELLRENNQPQLLNLNQKVNAGLNQNGFNKTLVTFFQNSPQVTHKNTINTVINTKRELSGIGVMDDGVFLFVAEPVMDGDNVVGVIEVKEEISVIRDLFVATNQKFAFLLDQKMLGALSLQAKSGRYKDVIADFQVKQENYDSRFYTNISELEPEEYNEFLQKKYVVTDIYYTSIVKASDVNGADIGMFLLGEAIVDDSEGFVNIADNMTKTVTTVALGLVISILLFMF